MPVEHDAPHRRKRDASKPIVFREEGELTAPFDDLEIPKHADESDEDDDDHRMEERRAPAKPLLALVFLQLQRSR